MYKANTIYNVMVRLGIMHPNIAWDLPYTARTMISEHIVNCIYNEYIFPWALGPLCRQWAGWLWTSRDQLLLLLYFGRQCTNNQDLVHMFMIAYVPRTSNNISICDILKRANYLSRGCWHQTKYKQNSVIAVDYETFTCDDFSYLDNVRFFAIHTLSFYLE